MIPRSPIHIQKSAKEEWFLPLNLEKLQYSADFSKQFRFQKTVPHLKTLGKPMEDLGQPLTHLLRGDSLSSATDSWHILLKANNVHLVFVVSNRMERTSNHRVPLPLNDRSPKASAKKTPIRHLKK